MTTRCPVDEACEVEELAALPHHLYEVHTEDDPAYDRWQVVERLLTQAVNSHLSGTPAPLPEVRNNCAFCQRERSAKDDNHAPECPYWVFFGPEGNQA